MAITSSRPGSRRHSKRYQVLIAGGGPVGHALGIMLAARGVECALVERHREPVRIPKGQNLTHRSAEHFWLMNCEEKLRAARTMPRGHPSGGITCYGSLTGEHWHASGIERARPVREYFFKANERLPQYRTEDVLRQRASELPGLKTFYGRIVRSVSEEAGGVSAVVADAPADSGTFVSWSADSQDADDAQGDGEVLEADYAVGCDGGRSLVRETMGTDRTGRDFDQRMVLTVFRSQELHEVLNRFPACSTYRVLKPELRGYWHFFGRVDIGGGFFFHAPVPKDTNRENFDFQALMEDGAGMAFEAEVDHVGFWDLRINVARDYRKGRMFLAGDAAHQHPPYGGFGLNTGLEDAANLAWKLTAKLEGWGSEALLDSYGAERRPIIVETGEDIIARRIESDRDWLDRCGGEGTDRFEEMWGEFGKGITAYIRTYEPHYEGSPVVLGPPEGRCSVHGDYTFAARPGHHLGPRTLSGGGNAFEALGRDFTLFAFDAPECAIGSFEAAAAALGVPLEVVRDDALGERKDYAARLVLVRPDQYVAWAGDELEAGASAILRRAVGRQVAPRFS